MKLTIKGNSTCTPLHLHTNPLFLHANPAIQIIYLATLLWRVCEVQSFKLLSASFSTLPHSKGPADDQEHVEPISDTILIDIDTSSGPTILLCLTRNFSTL